LFFQDLNGNKNNIIAEECQTTDGPYYHTGLDRVHIDKYKKLQRQILRYLSRIEIPSGREVPNDSESRETFCLDLLREYPSNTFLAPLKKSYHIEEKKDQVDIWSMNYEDFLRYYYEGLIERTGGNKREAAKRIGVNYQTFNSRYRSLFKE
jgi:DNA-binding NtrC family response regulator